MAKKNLFSSFNIDSTQNNDHDKMSSTLDESDINDSGEDYIPESEYTSGEDSCGEADDLTTLKNELLISEVSI